MAKEPQKYIGKTVEVSVGSEVLSVEAVAYSAGAFLGRVLDAGRRVLFTIRDDNGDLVCTGVCLICRTTAKGVCWHCWYGELVPH